MTQEVQMLAKSRIWNTKKIFWVWFSIGWVYGAVMGGFQYHWNTGFEFLFSMFFEGVGAGLPAGGIAALISFAHNRNVSRQPPQL
jgi:hypothetical protein